MTDRALLEALVVLKDKLVVAIADVERGDLIRASEVLSEARAHLNETVESLRVVT